MNQQIQGRQASALDRAKVALAHGAHAIDSSDVSELIQELEKQLEHQEFRADKFQGAARNMQACSAHIDRLRIANERINELEKLLAKRESDFVRLEWLAKNSVEARNIFLHIFPGQEKFLRGEIDRRMLLHATQGGV